MIRSDFHVGQKVIFGRTNGEKTLGKIEKLNHLKAKVKTLEDRGRDHLAGEVWSVPSMITPADKDGNPQPQPVKKLEFNQFQPEEDRYILKAIAAIYGAMSPENLSCDGEASTAHVRHYAALYRKKLNALFTAFGRSISESEIYEWERQEKEYEEKRI